MDPRSGSVPGVVHDHENIRIPGDDGTIRVRLGLDRAGPVAEPANHADDSSRVGPGGEHALGLGGDHALGPGPRLVLVRPEDPGGAVSVREVVEHSAREDVAASTASAPDPGRRLALIGPIGVGQQGFLEQAGGRRDGAGRQGGPSGEVLSRSARRYRDGWRVPVFGHAAAPGDTPQEPAAESLHRGPGSETAATDQCEMTIRPAGCPAGDEAANPRGAGHWPSPRGFLVDIAAGRARGLGGPGPRLAAWLTPSHPASARARR
jgi:hypothetical protein